LIKMFLVVSFLLCISHRYPLDIPPL